MRPRIRMTTVKKASKKHKPKNYKLPKLVQIGNSVGIVISKQLLRSICWKKGDKVDYGYSEEEQVLWIRNLSAKQSEYDALYE